MGTDGTRGTTGQVARWLLGAVLLVAGALSGAFGAVAWLSALRIQSFALALIGVVLLGLVPVVLGLGLVWTGLGVLELDGEPERELTDEELLQAAGDGATRDEVAKALGRSDPREAERRLDQLVVRELLELDVTDEGGLVYRNRDETRAD
jgi:hypothetical protein